MHMLKIMNAFLPILRNAMAYMPDGALDRLVSLLGKGVLVAIVSAFAYHRVG